MIGIVCIEPNGTIQEVNIEPTLNGFRRLLGGGWLEGISGTYIHEGKEHQWTGYVDEEGKLKGLPLNLVGTLLLANLGWSGAGYDVICGPIVLAGIGPSGTERSLPKPVLDYLLDTTI